MKHLLYLLLATSIFTEQSIYGAKKKAKKNNASKNKSKGKKSGSGGGSINTLPTIQKIEDKKINEINDLLDFLTKIKIIEKIKTMKLEIIQKHELKELSPEIFLKIEKTLNTLQDGVFEFEKVKNAKDEDKAKAKAKFVETLTSLNKETEAIQSLKETLKEKKDALKEKEKLRAEIFAKVTKEEKNNEAIKKLNEEIKKLNEEIKHTKTNIQLLEKLEKLIFEEINSFLKIEKRIQANSENRAKYFEGKYAKGTEKRKNKSEDISNASKKTKEFDGVLNSKKLNEKEKQEKKILIEKYKELYTDKEVEAVIQDLVASAKNDDIKKNMKLLLQSIKKEHIVGDKKIKKTIFSMIDFIEKEEDRVLLIDQLTKIALTQFETKNYVTPYIKTLLEIISIIEDIQLKGQNTDIKEIQKEHRKVYKIINDINMDGNFFTDKIEINEDPNTEKTLLQIEEMEKNLALKIDNEEKKNKNVKLKTLKKQYQEALQIKKDNSGFFNLVNSLSSKKRKQAEADMNRLEAEIKAIN